MRVNNKQNAFAFTLVELLVVIGIIAVLISILLPVLGKVRGNANDVKCRSNLKQIALATRMYENDNKDHLPDGYTLGGAFYRVLPGYDTKFVDPNSVPEVFGMPALYRDLGYMKSNDVWLCPGSRPEIMDWGFRNGYEWILPGGATIQSVTSSSISNSAKYTSGDRGKAEHIDEYFVWDNYDLYPWTSGSRRTSGSAGSFLKQVLPHNYKAKQISGQRTGSFNVLFIDGHVGVVVGTTTSSGSTKFTKLRDP